VGVFSEHSVYGQGGQHVHDACPMKFYQHCRCYQLTKANMQ